MAFINSIHMHYNSKKDYEEFDNPHEVLSTFLKQNKGELMIHLTERNKKNGDLIILVENFLKVNYDIRAGEVVLVAPEQVEGVTHFYDEKTFERYLNPFLEEIALIAKLSLLLELKKITDENGHKNISQVISKNHIHPQTNAFININKETIDKTLTEIQKQIKMTLHLFGKNKKSKLQELVGQMIKAIKQVRTMNEVEDVLKTILNNEVPAKTKTFSK